VKLKLLNLISFLCAATLFAQTSTVTVNQSTKVTQPPIGTLTLEGATNFKLTRGTGTPEGTVTAAPGSLYFFLSGKLWVKGSGTGNTGWTQTSTALTTGNLTGDATANISVTGGTGAVVGTGTSLSQHVADGTHNGYLSSADWTAFTGAVSGAGVSSWNARTGAVVPASNDYSEAQISFTDITTNNVSTSAHGYQSKLPGDSSLFYNGIGQYVAIPGSGSGVSQLISGGGVAWTGTGFNYIISSAVYSINGVQYSSPQTPVTLASADASQDRIDVFYVDTSNTAGVITGTPGTPPVQPSVDPASQLFLTFAYVVAASTQPSITNVNIYLENTEYTMSTNSAGTINLASTNNPYAGTKCIEGTSVAAGSLFTAVKPSGTLDLSQYTQLTFQIRSKATWANPKSMSIFWMNGSVPVVGTSVALKNGTFGFDSSNTSTYQQIVIPAANFGTGTNPVDRLRVSVSGGGGNIGWYIDNIILQAGGGGGGGGGTLTNFSAGNLSPLFTTSVTNPTTAPNLTFSLTDAGSHTYFGNATGSTSAASFTAAGTLSDAGTDGIVVTNGVNTLLSSASLAQHVADTTHNGYLSSTDWNTFNGKSTVTPAALTKGDDTNVTLTLGGTPATALLQAASITAGWTGTLSQARGGFGKSSASVTDGQVPIGKTSDGSWNFNTITQGTGITVTNGAGTITIAATAQAQSHAVTFVVDGGGGVLQTGTQHAVKIPYGGTLTGWLLIGSPSGSVTVDILRAADGAGLPVTSIIGGSGTKPSLSSAVENSSTSFTSWTSTTLTAKDNMAISLSGVSTATYCALTLYYQ